MWEGESSGGRVHRVEENQRQIVTLKIWISFLAFPLIESHLCACDSYASDKFYIYSK